MTLYAAWPGSMPPEPERQTAETQKTGKTVWDGAYTTDQAIRGKAGYEQNCIGCHRANDATVNAASRLKGDQFMHRWREDNIDSLFTLIKATMPRSKPGSLDDQIYIDIIAFLMQENGFPAGGAELTMSGLKDVQIEEKDGPKPLPHGALVQTVGCLTEGADSWILARASEPMRTRVPNESTAEELEAAQARPLGRLQFRLRNIEFLGSSFKPLSHKGHKMQVKGFIIRQTGRERIDITSMDMIADNCSQ